MDNTITIRDFLTSKQGKALVKYVEGKVREWGNKLCKESAWTYVLLHKAYCVLAEEWDCDQSFADWKLKPEILDAKPKDIFKSILDWALFDDYASNILSTDDSVYFNEKLSLFNEWLVDKPWQLDPFELKLPNE